MKQRFISAFLILLLAAIQAMPQGQCNELVEGGIRRLIATNHLEDARSDLDSQITKNILSARANTDKLRSLGLKLGRNASYVIYNGKEDDVSFSTGNSQSLTVYFSNRFLEKVSDQEIQAIIAHELAHDVYDGVRLYIAAELAKRLGTDFYEKERLCLEIKADLGSISILKGAGIDPTILAATLLDVDKIVGDSNAAKRIAAIKAALAKK